MKTAEEKRLRRQIEDYLRKYAGMDELKKVAELLGIIIKG